MLDKFKKLGKLKKLRDQANKLQDALADEEISVEMGNIKIVIGGDQKLKSVKVDEQENENLVKAINKAIKKSQKVAAKKMQEIGGLGGLGM
jgi:hypothetical protein